MNPMVTEGAAGAILLSPLTFVPGCEVIPASRGAWAGAPATRRTLTGSLVRW